MGFLSIFESKKKKSYSDREKLKAAHALNLCTVSVSQIIDYKDEYILEQEYNAILNNLNLEEMPKDEAFLSILKQLLDSVTYFRIQEGDKKFIEKEYQQKVKNAIWSAVPNFGVIVAGGLDPISIGISLVSQIGIGYMNYRKELASSNLEKEKQFWVLQRNAIDQFNTIRRELFDTAWRISETYNFPDEYRLTEKQISQFNEILLDVDVIRKYERLEAVSASFVAYPPFLYHLGNAAIGVSEKYAESDSEICEHYKTVAKKSYKKFFEIDYSLLREDLLAATCLLEYADLLDRNREIEIILKSIGRAQKLCGKDLDVLQLCAYGYLKVGREDLAEPILRVLVNESYNAVLNSQLLSRMYVSKYFSNINEANKNGIRTAYITLSTRVNPRYLFPFPNEKNKLNECVTEFINNQKSLLIQKLKLVIAEVFAKYGIMYNKVIPVPNPEKVKSDAYFFPSKEADDYRHKEILNYSVSKKYDSFLDEIRSKDLKYEWMDILNKLLISVSYFSEFISMDELSMIVNDKLRERIDTLNKVNEDGFKLNAFVGYLKQLDYNYFTDSSKDFVSGELIKYVQNELSRIDNISNFEDFLRQYCVSENIEEPVLDIEFKEHPASIKNDTMWINAAMVFGSNYKEIRDTMMARKDAAKKMTELISQKANGILLNKKSGSFFIKTKDYLLRAYEIRNEKHISKIKNSTSDCEIFAALEFRKFFGDFDLIFTNRGLYFSKIEQVISYDSDDISPDKKDASRLNIGTSSIKESDIEVGELFNLLQELKNIHFPQL